VRPTGLGGNALQARRLQLRRTDQKGQAMTTELDMCDACGRHHTKWFLYEGNAEVELCAGCAREIRSREPGCLVEMKQGAW